MGRAPTVDLASQLTLVSQLQPGDLTAPGLYYLPLLPSGPDGLHSSPPRKTQSSIPLYLSSPEKRKPRTGIQPRYSGSRVQGTASSPSSTAHINTTMEQESFQGYKPWLKRNIRCNGNSRCLIFSCVASISYSIR